MEGSNILQLIDDLRKDIAEVFNESGSADDKTSTSLPEIDPIKKKDETLPTNPILLEANQNDEGNFENFASDTDINKDVRKMRQQLQNTYDLLISARDALEGINFGNLKNRINNLRIDPVDAEVDEFMKFRPFKENIEGLTDLMKEKFKHHPKEFEDIPELNTFFRTCSQLQLGLEKLTKQTDEYSDLEKRITQATEDHESRIIEIHSDLKRLMEKHN